MATFKTIKKHNKHLNNPFPTTPKSLPIIQGALSINPHSLPSHHVYSIGTDFRASWSSRNGGSFSICHISHPKRSIWSTIPGKAFISAAIVETEVEESRGSFAISDCKVNLVCKHQTIEEIKVINLDSNGNFFEGNDHDFPSWFPGIDLKSPVLVISGRVFSMNKKKNQIKKSAKYWVLFYQKNNHQTGFQVKVDKPKHEFNHLKSKGVDKKSSGIRRRRFGLSWLPSRPRGFVGAAVVSDDEREEKWLAKSAEFNRICITYSSDENERFYGFGEQFSHMDFKGKRVPIFVQEQGIGRGDQPISFAINLVSYR